jgi:hypothetical protein
MMTPPVDEESVSSLKEACSGPAANDDAHVKDKMKITCPTQRHDINISMFIPD